MINSLSSIFIVSNEVGESNLCYFSMISHDVSNRSG